MIVWYNMFASLSFFISAKDHRNIIIENLSLDIEEYQHDVVIVLDFGHSPLNAKTIFVLFLLSQHGR